MLDEITDKDHPDHFHLTSSLKQLKQFVKKINVLVKKSTEGEDYKRYVYGVHLKGKLNTSNYSRCDF